MTDIGARIRAVRDRLGWTSQKLATLAGIDQGFLSKIETGKANGSWETYGKIAGALGVSLDKLVMSESNVEDAPIGTRRIPLLEYGQVAEWAGTEPAPGMETILADLEHSPSTFALKIRDDSMAPGFLAGDVIVVDPKVEPLPGDGVVARDELGEVIFRQYRNGGVNEKGQKVFELHPLNPIYAPLRSDRQWLAIVGVMVEHRRYRKR